MALYQQSFSVFSTYVEVILHQSGKLNRQFGFLHVCGGDPDVTGDTLTSAKFSPRMWR